MTLDKPLTMIEQAFTEANLSWDLASLYADLAEVKRVCRNPNRQSVPLSEVETACLRGLLCGYSPADIAIALNRDTTGLRVDLSRGLYEYLEILTEQRPKNWRQISFLLERAGYRRTAILNQSPEQNDIQQDLGVVVDVSRFCGRVDELNTLQHWMHDSVCRVIMLVGMGGIGKTFLAAKAIQTELTQTEFTGVIWRSLRSAPPIHEALTDLLKFVSPEQEIPPATSTDQLISWLLSQLRQQRILIVLDDWESILQEGAWAGHCAPEHQGYAQLLNRSATEYHQSCLLLLSREFPIEVMPSETAAVRCLKLKGVSLQTAKTLLTDRGYELDETGLPELIEIHRGNPAAILRAAATIQDLFDGNSSQFLTQTSLVLGDVVLDLLEQQLERLSAAEYGIVAWLAIVGQPLSINELKLKLDADGRSHLLTALESLRRRSLIEKLASTTELKEPRFTLEPVVMKYVVQQFINQFCDELNAVLKTQVLAQLKLLRSHVLVDVFCVDDDQRYQSRRILNRVCDRLIAHSGDDIAHLRLNLERLLTQLRDRESGSFGHAETNVTIVLNRITLSSSV